MTTTDKIIASIVEDATPVRPAPHPYLLGAKWLLGMAVYCALTLIFSGLRPDLLLKFHSPVFVAELAVLLGIILTTCLSAALLAYPDLHQKRRVALAPVVMLALFILVMFWSWTTNTQPTHLSGHSVQCTIYISSLTLLPAAWMLYAMRSLASTHPYLAGSLALLAAFAIGALSLRLSEQTDSIVHVMQWHYLPMIGAGLIGLGLGKLVLRW